MKKKFLLLLPFMALPLATSLTACNSGPKIGILAPVEHSALNKAKEGFIQGLKDGGLSKFNIQYKNAAGKEANLNSGAKSLVSSCELTLGLGTGASQMLKGVSENAGSTKPVMFTAVTDPVSAGLVASNENTTGFVCGTSDLNPIVEQIEMIKEFKPSASKIGILYTQTETNSKFQSDIAEAEIKKEGMEVVIKTCKDSSDVKATASALADSGVDAIYIPTDNNVADNMNAVKSAVTGKQILVVCGEENMVKSGGHVTLSLDYFDLGQKAGVMAAQIIKGEKAPSDFPVAHIPASECFYRYSALNLADAGLSMTEAILNAHQWTNMDD